VTTALWTHVVIGLVVLVVAVAEIVWTHKHGPTVAA
jgi:cytochrome b561